MKTLQGISSLSVVALSLVSCTSHSNVSKAPTPKPSVETASVAPKPSTSSSPANVLPKGLIAPTDPLRLPISKGRVDPFGSVAVTPIKQLVPGQTTHQNQTQPDKSRQNNSQTNKPQQNKSQQNNSQTNKPQQNKSQQNNSQTNKPQQNKSQQNNSQTNKPQQNKSQQNNSQTNKPQQNKSQQNNSQTNKPQQNKPQQNKSQPDQSQPNKPQPNNFQPDTLQLDKSQQNPTLKQPSTEVARAVEVSGVTNIGGTVRAIVKEPNETITRSVSEGDYLAKGAVLVKRIQIDSDQEPSVILEQNGVEVIKPVKSTNSPIASLQ
jgi:hypothetical protein